MFNPLDNFGSKVLHAAVRILSLLKLFGFYMGLLPLIAMLPIPQLDCFWMSQLQGLKGTCVPVLYQQENRIFYWLQDPPLCSYDFPIACCKTKASWEREGDI